MPRFRGIIKAQKVMWIKRLLDNKSRKWKALSEAIIGFPLKELECKNDHKFHKHVKNKFYNQMLEFWYELHSVPPIKENIKEEILWNNKFILIDNTPINTHYVHWKNQGIVTLEDLTDTKGNLLLMKNIEEQEVHGPTRSR